MPRKVKSSKKQTRLAFASAPAAAPVENENGGDDSDRYRTLSYGHPSSATVVPKRSNKIKSSLSSSSQTRSSQSSQEQRPAQTKPQPTLHVLDDTSSDDEIIITSAQKRRHRAADTTESTPNPPKFETSKTKKKSRRAPSPDVDLEEMEETPRPRRKLKRKAESSPVIQIDSDSDDEPVLSSPVKRRRTFVPEDTPETPRAGTDQDDLDIEEDVRDLQDSVVKKTRTRGRMAESARDKRFKTLEAIRRKRAGHKEETDESEAGSDEDEDEGEDSPSKQGGAMDVEEEEEDDEELDGHMHPSDEDLDRYEEDFVLDDDSAPLGVPTEEIPFEFTRHAYKKPKDYFRDVVGWMVHNRLDPAFPRSDAMYEMAFMKLEDEVKGRAGSQLISSVWNADFRYALLARPHIEVTSYPTLEFHSCDACNRSGHPASSDMKLYGKPYSLETLEPIADSDEDQSVQTSDSDSDEESSNGRGRDRDRDGHALPGEEKRFLLGRQCGSRAQLAHTLTHWRFHLYEWVVDYLKRMGHMSDEQVLRRNNMSQKRKTRNAIKVLESMIEAGEIEKLWRDFHLTLKSAREETS